MIADGQHNHIQFHNCSVLPNAEMGDPAYQERFGADSYEAMLGNCLWGMYQMIGKLNPRVYVPRR